MGKPFKSPPFKCPPFAVPLPPEFNMPLPMRYVKMFVHVKRNGNIIHYCTSYTPFGTERPIQPQEV